MANLPTRAVRYLEAGSGTALVLLHAFPLNAEQWLPQFARVPPGWRVVAPDLRGFGGTEPAYGSEDATITIDTYARDVVELMSHLDIPRAVVCGLSMGGYVALAVLRRAASRVSGLVLADTKATEDSADARLGRDRMSALLEREGMAGIATAMVPRLLAETTRREQPDLVDAVVRLIESNSPVGIQAAIRAMRDRPDATSLLAGLTCPTTIICGEEDVVTPPGDAEALHHAVHGSRYIVVPRAGHLSNLENPMAFNAALYSHPMPPAKPRTAVQ